MPFCSKCDYYTDRSHNLKTHMKVHDGNRPRPPKRTYNCQLCSVVSNRDGLIQHFTSVHNIPISKKELHFENKNAFFSWKAQIEADTLSRFVKRKGDEKCKDYKTSYYHCHRDGFFSPKGTGKRRLKLIGSNKINTCCPARMRASTDIKIGTVNVEFTETHVGHKHDLGRLCLSKDEKREIASQIAGGVPFKEILKDVSKSVQREDLKVIHLLTNKDLWNIQQEFKLNKKSIGHQNNYSSVHSWVTQNQGHKVVRFYKQQGLPMASHPELLLDDFVLVFANDSQLSMLEEFGNECVCLDRTHGDDLELTTILVLDELRQGFPCGFMLSNRTDAAAMKLFFAVIKEALDSSVAPKVFMSDVAEVYKNAWCAVMSPPENFLYCTWHVDCAWKTNLCKVKDDMKKVEIYKTLRTLLEETDENSFKPLLEASLTNFLNDPDTTEFGKYFKSEYAGSAQQWAFCYRNHLGLDTNMHLESLHKTIKHCYFEGQKVKRLDKCLRVLMRVIQDKLFYRVITYHPEKVAKKLGEIQQCHTAALQMKDVQLSPMEHQGWSISLGKPSTTYSIIPWKSDCTCNLRCEDCNLCIHAFMCDCLDSSINWVICRHIHHMAITTASNESADTPECHDSPNEGNASDFEIDDQPVDNVVEIESEEISHAEEKSVCENTKKELLEEFRETLDLACSTEDFDLIRKTVRSLIPKLKAAHSTNKVSAPKRKVNTLQKISLDTKKPRR